MHVEYPLVTVVVPLFNARAFVEPAIAQISAQTYPHLEVLLIDDGSSDDSYEEALRAASGDERIRVLKHEINSGVVVARQTAAKAGRGDYFWFVDADDYWPPSALHDLVAGAVNERTDVVVASARYVYPSPRDARPITPPQMDDGVDGVQAFRMLLDGEIKGHLWNKLFSRRAINSMDFAFSRVHSDLSMVAQALAHAREVQVTAGFVYDYIIRDGSIITSRTKRLESLETVLATVETEYKRLAPHAPSLSGSFAYFAHRFIWLSALKDVSSAGLYSAKERKILISQIRSRMSWRGALESLRRRDVKRAAAIVICKVSASGYQVVMRRLG